MKELKYLSYIGSSRISDKICLNFAGHLGKAQTCNSMMHRAQYIRNIMIKKFTNTPQMSVNYSNIKEEITDTL